MRGLWGRIVKPPPKGLDSGIKCLTDRESYAIVKKHMEKEVFFFLTLFTREFMEVEVVRTKITLACTECKQRNYNMTKDKKAHPDRMETKKYCRFCKKHTMHKETK